MVSTSRHLRRGRFVSDGQSVRRVLLVAAVIVDLFYLQAPNGLIADAKNNNRKKMAKKNRTYKMVYNSIGEVESYELWKLPMTYGQKPPGDESYITAQCATPVLPGAKKYEGLKNPVFSSTSPPAWGKDHFTHGDLMWINSTIMAGLAADAPCPYLLQDCGSLPAGVDASSLPSLPRGSLGTCALVAAGDILHRRPYGPEIDAHDTVIRISTPPLLPFASHTGLKVDALVTHFTAGFDKLPELYQNTSYIFGPRTKGQPESVPSIMHNPDTWTHGPAGKLGLEGYKKFTKPIQTSKLKPRHLSSGLKYVLTLLFSRLCERLDLYGFSPYHNSRYYCKGSRNAFPGDDFRPECNTFKLVHSPALEVWMYHYIMAKFPETGVCVYM